jgi:putative protease
MTPPKTMRAPELLAPAGGRDALRAAVANGADAVYLGLSELNARRGAENFTLETLAEATRFAHLRGVRVYLTANVVVLADEMDRAVEMVAGAWEAGVDAVIVQDLGLLRVLRASLPEVRIHASTQIDAHNAETVSALADLGVSRVTLARELSLSEIGDLTASSPVELESFVHGSLCFCHSGQCLMSSMIGGRSANRGTCAQPCRLPYDLIDAAGQEAETPGRHLLSPKDLAGVTLLPGLVRSGLAALKIEGRMKSPEYVATVVRVYRAALDRAAAAPDSYQVTEAEWDLLSEAFSRGFSEAYLSDIRGDEMMSYQRPNNRGVPVGRVVSTAEGRAVVALDRAVESGDILEFWTSAGRVTGPAGRMDVNGSPVTAAPAGVRAEVALDGQARAGDRVFRVSNASLMDAARRTFSGDDDDLTPVVFGVRLRVGEPVSVTAEAAGLSAIAEGPIAEAARTRAVSAEDVAEHVGRLGGSGYRADGWRIELDPGVGVGFSTLHALRREALQRLDALRLAAYAGRSLERARPVELPPARRAAPEAAPRVVVALSDPSAIKSVLAAGADSVLLSAWAADPSEPLPRGVELLLPRIAHPAEVRSLLDRVAEGPATAGNLGMLAALGASGSKVSADWGLNAVNPWTVAALADLGASFVWASPELSGRQLATLVERSSVPVGTVVHGRLELMIAEHCVLQASGACSHDCARCRRRREPFALRDRKGYVFPVTTDATGRAHIYNSVTMDLSRAIKEVVASGVSAIRLDLHLETPAEAAALVRAYRSLLQDVAAERRPPDAPLVSPSTSGHFFRGLS